MSSTRAVFFDRDGTLIENVGYCSSPRLVRVFPGVAEALARLKRAGYENVIVTNQSAIGRGFITRQQYREVHAELLRLLGPGLIDATYFAPDSPERASFRRKPLPGMLFEAAAERHLDLGRSFLVGDTPTDIQCGISAGVRTILVATGGAGADADCTPDVRAKDVPEAVAWILARDD